METENYKKAKGLINRHEKLSRHLEYLEQDHSFFFGKNLCLKQYFDDTDNVLSDDEWEIIKKLLANKIKEEIEICENGINNL